MASFLAIHINMHLMLRSRVGHINSGYDFIDPILELGAHVAPTGIIFMTDQYVSSKNAK